MKEEKSVIIQSVGRAIQILKCFESYDELGLTDISKLIGLHKSTTFGLISTLEAFKLLERKPSNGKYKLGIEVFRLSTKVNVDLRRIVTPYLEKLVEMYQETANLVVRDDHYVVYLEKLESPHSMRICTRVGDEIYIYCTGVGKIILANLDEDELDEILNKIEFKSFTKHTLVDKEQFKEHLKQCRKLGYAEDNEEREIGLTCVAAPIYNHMHKPIGAISISGPSSRMDEELRVDMRKTLIEFADEISRKIGY